MKSVIANEVKQSRRTWQLRIASSLALLAMTAATEAQSQIRGSVEAIPDAVWTAMQGRSWHAGQNCPSRETLALVRVRYRDYAGTSREGTLIVGRRVAPQIAAIFADIHASGFRIARMEPIDTFGGDDDRSMAANNTSAFNCRNVVGTNRPSAHAAGLAIDINPVQNPYVLRNETAPPAGRAYDNDVSRKTALVRGEIGLVMPGDAVVRAFEQHGWRWGGDWRNERDYQHFYAPER